MKAYEPVIGLEIHVELKTKTKMFCSSLNDPDEKHPNTNVCPICMGFPGTLPVINKNAIKEVLKVGLALGGEIPETSWFERKSYFYPDLPKGYQISQYEKPLISSAKLEIKNEKGEARVIRIRRVHIEEDTGRLIHDMKERATLVDFNRAGVPLMELVTEPDLHSSREARIFAQELRLFLRYLKVSDADMEKGQLRVEANISLSPSANRDSLGTKVEIKNLNSFRSVEMAIDYEIKRMTKLLEQGKEIVQETRGWDESRQVTVSQRTKEEAGDYRYFPEPDLPILVLKGKGAHFDLRVLIKELPELPWQKRLRLLEEYKIKPSDIEILVQEPWLAQFYEEVVSELYEWEEASPKKVMGEVLLSQLAANWVNTDLKKIISAQEITGRADLDISAENFAELLTLIAEGSVSSRIAKDLLLKMFHHPHTGPRDILRQESMEQISGDDELRAAVQQVIESNAQAVQDYRKGKTQSLQFLVGQVMKETKGRGNPEMVKHILTDILG